MFMLLVISVLVVCGAAAAQPAALSAGELWDREVRLGQNLQVRGRYQDAEQHFRKALEAADALGPRDPRAFATRVALGLVAATMGRYVDAEQWDNDAIRMGQEIYGKDAPELALPFTNLAVLFRDQGEYGPAEDYCRRALSLSAGGAPNRLAHVLGTLGGILYHRGRLAEAESSLRESIRIAEKLPQPNEILAGDLNNLAGVYSEAGRREEALVTLQRAYDTYEQLGGSNRLNLFYVLAGMAAVQAQSGRYADAVTAVESGIRFAENAGAGNTMLVRDALLSEAAWLHELKREADAKRVRQKAKRVAQAASRNSYAQYTVDARQAARSAAQPSE